MMSEDQLSRQPASVPFSIPLNPVSTQDVVEVVIERIIEILGSHTLGPDQKLPPEKEFMIAFEVGRSSIREALRSLVAMNLLETRSGKGYFVSPVAPSLIRAGLIKPGSANRADFHEIMETRKVLELAIARLSLTRATEEDLQAVRRAGEELRAAADGNRELLPYTMRVHLAIVSAANNTFLKSLFTDLLPWIMAQFQPVQVPAKLDVQMHIQLMQGFIRRDTEKVLTAIEDHHHFWCTRFVERFPNINIKEEEGQGGKHGTRLLHQTSQGTTVIEEVH